MAQSELKKFTRKVAKNFAIALKTGSIDEDLLITVARMYSGHLKRFPDERGVSNEEAALKADLYIKLIEQPSANVLSIIQDYSDDLKALREVLQANEDKKSPYTSSGFIGGFL